MSVHTGGSLPRLALLGVPDHGMRWMTAALHRLFERSAGVNIPIIYLDDDPATEVFLAKPGGEPALLVSHYPREQLYQYLSDESIPTLVLVDDLVRCSVQHQEAGYANLFDAIRAVSRSLVLLDRSRLIPRRVLLSQNHMARKADTFFRIMAQTIFNLDPESVIETATDLFPLPDGSIAENSTCLFRIPDAPEYAINDEQIEWIGSVCNGLAQFIAGKQSQKVTWPFSFFTDGDFQKSPPPMVQELTGQARCIYFGPYLYLSRGKWQGEVLFGLSKEVVETHLRVEISAQEILADFVTCATRGGFFALPIHFEVMDARLAIEVRIFLDRGEIGGRIGLHSVVLWPDEPD